MPQRSTLDVGVAADIFEIVVQDVTEIANGFVNEVGGGPPLASEAFLNILGSWVVHTK